MKVLFDSNILIDHLRAIVAARAELGLYKQRERYISVIGWREVMAGTTPSTNASIRIFLSEFTVLPISDKIAERTAELRRERKIKLPDAVVWATAEVNGLLLVTRNSRDFPGGEPFVRIPYTV